MSLTFNDKTTAEDVAAIFASNIAGKTIIITGPSPGGLGFETARVLAKHSPKLLVLAGRDATKLQETEDAIRKETPTAQLRQLILDLASLSKVREAAKEVLAYPESVDILINNAAVMACPYGTTIDGNETQFGTAHLGHFLFTTSIMPKLLASASPRVVNVSSLGHHWGDVRYNDPGFSEGKEYDKWAAYGQAKTANILFTVELTARYKDKGVTALSLHPGGINTNISRHFTPSDFQMMRERYPDAINEDGTLNTESGVLKTLGAGASTQVRAALDPSLAAHSGSFLVDCQIANDQAKAYALDKDNAKKLWELTEKLVA